MHNVASYVRKILSVENFLKICVTMLCCSRSKNVFICVMFRKNDHKYVKCICVAKLYFRQRIQSVLMCCCHSAECSSAVVHYVTFDTVCLASGRASSL